METIPAEIVLHIMDRCSARDVIAMAICSSSFMYLLHDKLLWLYITFRDYGISGDFGYYMQITKIVSARDNFSDIADRVQSRAYVSYQQYRWNHGIRYIPKIGKKISRAINQFSQTILEFFITNIEDVKAISQVLKLAIETIELPFGDAPIDQLIHSLGVVIARKVIANNLHYQLAKIMIHESAEKNHNNPVYESRIGELLWTILRNLRVKVCGHMYYHDCERVKQIMAREIGDETVLSMSFRIKK